MSVAEHLVWRGSPADFARLVEAVDHNCPMNCSQGNGPQSNCPTHSMLNDQRQLNRLEYVWTEVGTLLHEEFDE